MREQLMEVFKDNEFTKKALEMTPEELRDALLEKGVDISLDDIIDAGKMINEVLVNNDELDLASLDTVAGGGWDAVAGVVVGVLLGVGALGIGAASVMW